ncbi:TfoX/Sxy family DNA transformation protein [Vibrio sp.]|nr:TfoX/Sxy family DNA transformation protein [Vibrio sp.]
MTEQQYMDFMSQHGEFQRRSMFGGIGLFQDEAMFSLIVGDRLFIRGGDNLDAQLIEHSCEKYRHVKKQTTATVNYYDVTNLYLSDRELLSQFVSLSIEIAVKQRQFQKSSASRRLRDLPNMQLTLERMVKKSGIQDVDTFLALGAEKVFTKVKYTYGSEVDIKLLWKFAGAVDGIHWKLIQESRKQELLSNCELAA